jgi:hypothetical protein
MSDDGCQTERVFWPPPSVICPLIGAIAQLGERLLCKQEVVGSIPSGSTRRLPRSSANSFVRILNSRALDPWSTARVLSDIVKRRSIRAPRVTKIAGGALSPFGGRNSVVSNQNSFWMTDAWWLIPETSAELDRNAVGSILWSKLVFQDRADRMTDVIRMGIDNESDQVS